MNDTQWKGIAMGNLGINHHLMGNDDEAIPLMNIDLQIAKKYEDWGPAAEALTNLSYISFRSGIIAQSKQMAYEAMGYAHKSGQQKRLLKIFPLLSKLEAYDMNPALAEIYMDSALMVKDSLDQIFNGQHLLRAKQRIQMEQQKFKAEKLEQEQQAGLKLRNAAITILILVLLILILIYYNHRLKIKNRIRLLASKAEMEKELNDIQLENVQLEKQHLLDQLEFKERELTSYALSLVRKNELLQRLEERIKFMDHGNSDIKSISNIIRTNTTQEGEWSEFNLRFNQVHKGFYETLREKFPDLSQNEERICALIRLNLNSREIANMLNINSRSVDQNKYSLKKKLKLNAEEGLHEYIAGL